MEIKTYEQHYNQCKKAYIRQSSADIEDISVEVDFCKNIDLNLINQIDLKILKKLENNTDTSDTRWSRHITSWHDIEEIEELCQIVMPEIEEKYFGCYLKVEHLHIYQNKTNIPLESSWQWHYDDCPKEFVKFAIYVNDVGEESGAMQVLKSSDSFPVLESFRTSPDSPKGYPPPVFPKSRIPDSFIESALNKGGEVFSLTGARGTHFLFTPNVIHRGTEPKKESSPRRAIFFFIRPSLTKQENYSKNAQSVTSGNNVKRYKLD